MTFQRLILVLSTVIGCVATDLPDSQSLVTSSPPAPQTTEKTVTHVQKEQREEKLARVAKAEPTMGHEVDEEQIEKMSPQPPVENISQEKVDAIKIAEPVFSTSHLTEKPSMPAVQEKPAEKRPEPSAEEKQAQEEPDVKKTEEEKVHEIQPVSKPAVQPALAEMADAKIRAQIAERIQAAEIMAAKAAETVSHDTSTAAPAKPSAGAVEVVQKVVDSTTIPTQNAALAAALAAAAKAAKSDLKEMKNSELPAVAEKAIELGKSVATNGPAATSKEAEAPQTTASVVAVATNASVSSANSTLVAGLNQSTTNATAMGNLRKQVEGEASSTPFLLFMAVVGIAAATYIMRNRGQKFPSVNLSLSLDRDFCGALGSDDFYNSYTRSSGYGAESKYNSFEDKVRGMCG